MKPSPRSTLIINRQPPHSTLASREALDATLASAAFGVELALLFLEDAVFQILKNQDTGAARLKNSGAMFDSLEMYDVTRIYVRQQDLSLRNLTPDHFRIPVQALTDQEAKTLIQLFDNLLTF